MDNLHLLWAGRAEVSADVAATRHRSPWAYLDNRRFTAFTRAWQEELVKILGIYRRSGSPRRRILHSFLRRLRSRSISWSIASERTLSCFSCEDMQAPIWAARCTGPTFRLPLVDRPEVVDGPSSISGIPPGTGSLSQGDEKTHLSLLLFFRLSLSCSRFLALSLAGGIATYSDMHTTRDVLHLFALRVWMHRRRDGPAAPTATAAAPTR